MAKVSVNKHLARLSNAYEPAAVRTKKYAHSTQKYISLAMRYFFKTQPKWVLFPWPLILINAVNSPTGVYPNLWIYITGCGRVCPLCAFLAIQFTGITSWRSTSRCSRNSPYEIDNRQILMKLNQKEVKRPVSRSRKVLKTKTLTCRLFPKDNSHLPFTIFTSEHDIKV